MLHAMTKHYISRLTELRECDCWNQGRGTVSFKLPAGFLRARKHVSKGRPDAAVTNTSLPSSSYYDGKIVMICAMLPLETALDGQRHLREGEALDRRRTGGQEVPDAPFPDCIFFADT
jgi:hypothetical protein